MLGSPSAIERDSDEASIEVSTEEVAPSLDTDADREVVVCACSEDEVADEVEAIEPSTTSVTCSVTDSAALEADPPAASRTAPPAAENPKITPTIYGGEFDTVPVTETGVETDDSTA
jgi:hypothetical protein